MAAIEILSPKQALEELIDKANVYLTAGVKSCWVALPAMRSIAVYSAPGQFAFYTEKDTLNDNALGISLPLAPVFG